MNPQNHNHTVSRCFSYPNCPISSNLPNEPTKQADVFVNDNEGKPVNVATIQPGGFFGELSLMYSQPRTATVKGRR
jgi:hypothetical protein